MLKAQAGGSCEASMEGNTEEEDAPMLNGHQVGLIPVRRSFAWATIIAARTISFSRGAPDSVGFIPSGLAGARCRPSTVTVGDTSWEI